MLEHECVSVPSWIVIGSPVGGWRDASQMNHGSPAEPGGRQAVRVFGADRRQVGAARLFCADVLSAWGLTAAIGDVALVVSELATNAVVHAGTLFGVLLSLDGSQLRLTVRDESRERLVDRPQDCDATMGRGLHIVDALALAWGVNDDDSGKSTWARFHVDCDPVNAVETSSSAG